MARQSAGILVYRRVDGGCEVLLVHPGGPFWAKKDLGTWSIPKGEFGADEDPFAAGRREFFEETGLSVEGDFVSLGQARQAGGKVVYAWAVEGDVDAAAVRSNTFRMEWPPGSGRQQEFPEIDRAAWFTPEAAREKIHKGQAVFIDRLVAQLGIV